MLGGMMSDPSVQKLDSLRRFTALLQAGRHAEAAAVLRREFDLAPDDPAVRSAVAQISALTRSLLTFGRSQEALAAIAPVAESSHAHGELLMLYGHALMSLGRKDDAEAVLRRWAEEEPGNRAAALRLAAVLADNGKPGEAESVVRTDIRRHGKAIDAAFVLGRSLLAQGRFGEAEAEFHKVVQARPDHQIAQSNLMELAWMRTGDIHAAGHAIDQALRTQPHLRGLRITKARLLVSARMPREALAEIDANLAGAPQDVASLASATTIALDFDGERAMEYAQRLLEVAPNDRSARVAWGNASLATGRPQAALGMAEDLYRSDPNDGQALAMRADALRMLGDPRYRALLDYRNLVRAEFIDVPDGWPDLGAYLAELTQAVQNSHTLQAHPIGNSLRGGSQIQLSPQKSPYPAIRAFPRAIDGAVTRYIDALGNGADAMRRRNAGGYQLAGMWSVRLRPNGFHVNHYHPEGWISSAFYLHLPPAVEARGGEGWLKFGEPAFPTLPALQPEYFIKPEPGLLVLFPSYMWHGTVPFSGGAADSRLTIAFDVVPSAPVGMRHM